MADRGKAPLWKGQPEASVVAVGRKPLGELQAKLTLQVEAQYERSVENRHSEHIIQELVDGGEGSSQAAIRVMEFGLPRSLPCCGHALNLSQPHHGFAAYTNRQTWTAAINT